MKFYLIAFGYKDEKNRWIIQNTMTHKLLTQWLTDFNGGLLDTVIILSAVEVTREDYLLWKTGKKDGKLIGVNTSELAEVIENW